MKKMIASFFLCAVVFVMLQFPAYAESMGDNGNNYRAAAVNDNDDNMDWGWLGLIGLIGLAGLAGRNRDRRPQR